MTATGVAPARSPVPAPRPRAPRYELTAPWALTVLRSGMPNLIESESVRIEFLVPHTNSPVLATAVARHQHEGRFGPQVLRLPDEQQPAVCYWMRREGELLLPAEGLPAEELELPASPLPELALPKQPSPEEASATLREAGAKPDLPADFESPENSSLNSGVRRIVWFALSITVITAALGWWQWQQRWAELEAHLPAKEALTAPQLKVPGDAMGQRIIHQVLPEYPEPARQAGVQGTVVLDTVVSVEGAVTQVKFVSGPRLLSQAAMDAVRWWRYEPYSVNGRPATVETTVAVDFRLTN